MGKQSQFALRIEMVKKIIFLGLTFVASIFLGRVLGFFFLFSFFEFLTQLPQFVLEVIFSFLFLTLSFCLPALFLQREMFLFAFVNCLALLVGLGGKGGVFGLLLALFYFFSQYLFWWGVKKRGEMFIDFFPREIFLPKVTLFLFSLNFLFSLTFFFAVQKEIKEGRFVLPEEVFFQLKGPLERIFQKSFERSLEMRFGEELEREIGAGNPEEIAEFLRREAEETAREGTLRQKFGFRPEIFTWSDMKPEEWRKRVWKMVKPFVKYLPFIAGLSLFFTLKVISGFLLALFPFLLSGMFWVLQKTGIFEIVEREETVRRLSL